MRIVVIVFAILAGIKVWTQDKLVRTALGDALIQAYREKAVSACRKLPVKPALVFGDETTVSVGNGDIEVAFWDVNSPLWQVRFRHPHIMLRAVGPDGLQSCAYDVVAGLATIAAK